MTPEELREKVARALFRSAVDDGGHINGFLPYNQQPEATQRHYECLADAAISVVREAMREPSEEMMDAWEKLKHPPHHENRLATKQANIYRAMLPHSPLAEPKP